MDNLFEEKFFYRRKKFLKEKFSDDYVQISGTAFFVEPVPESNQRIVYSRYQQTALTGLDFVAIAIERYYANEELLFALKRAKLLSGLVSIWITPNQVIITFQHEFFNRTESYLAQIKKALQEMYRRSYFKLTKYYNGKPQHFAQYRVLTAEQGFESLLTLFQPYRFEIFFDFGEIHLEQYANLLECGLRPPFTTKPNPQVTDPRADTFTLYSDDYVGSRFHMESRKSAIKFYSSRLNLIRRKKHVSKLKEENPNRAEFTISKAPHFGPMGMRILDNDETTLLRLLRLEVQGIRHDLESRGLVDWKMLSGLEFLPVSLREMLKLEPKAKLMASREDRRHRK